MLFVPNKSDVLGLDFYHQEKTCNHLACKNELHLIE